MRISDSMQVAMEDSIRPTRRSLASRSRIQLPGTGIGMQEAIQLTRVTRRAYAR